MTFGVKSGDSLMKVHTPMRNETAMVRIEAVKETIGKVTMRLTGLDDESKRSFARKR